MRILKNSYIGLISFCLIYFITSANVLETAEFKLGSKADYNNKQSDIVYGSKNASYITKTSGGYAFVQNAKVYDTYKQIKMLAYSDNKDSYAYLGIDNKNGQNIVYNNRKIRHSMDNIICLSVSSKTFMYVGEKNGIYSVYLNTKKAFEFEEEITSAILLENGSSLISFKNGNSYKIFLNTKEVAQSQIEPQFYKHGKYTIIVHSNSKSDNNKSISIADNYKKLETFDMPTFDGFNRIGDFHTSDNEKSYVLIAYKTNSQNATIIANNKVGDDITKLNRIIFSPNGLRYLLDVKKSNGSYIIGDNEEFGPYSDSIVDMAFSTDSLLWGFLGRYGAITVLVIDSEAITGYHYANDISFSKSGNQWSMIVSNGNKHFLYFYSAINSQPNKVYEANKIYTLGMSDSTKRIGFIYEDDDGKARINIDNEVLGYEASSKYPFIVVTDKNYMSIVEDDNKYALILNGEIVAKFDEIYEEPSYSSETSEMHMTYLNGSSVYVYRKVVP